MANPLVSIIKSKDLRTRIGYVLLMLVLFRVIAHITLPGIDLDNLRNFLGSNQIFGLLNLFSGGALDNFSMVALGVGPYITAAIIMQMLVYVVPYLERQQKEEGEAGRKRINQITRWMSLPLAVIQAYGLIIILERSGAGVLSPTFGAFEITAMIIAMTGGSVFLMWLGELITERGVGNGVSLLIFAGIVAALPSSLRQTISAFDSSQVLEILAFAVIAILTVAGIVFITEGQRKIPVTYARRSRAAGGGGSESVLPLRVNQAGVIPIIFAISIMIFPSVIANFFIGSDTAWVADTARYVNELFANDLFYAVLYFALVVAFTYFYVGFTFDPKQISENLQRQGGFIPGVRPGTETDSYLKRISSRITLTGALFLGVVAILPNIMEQFVSSQSLQIGGTGILIVVSVVIETVRQIEAQLVMRDYESFY
ncbi:MAG: preprotein translocase subunit SecY [Candidatus Doudnabacteria bacterium]|nr:preprotein translocase subunit SecY [Candidatus Doudnabacteria bacterium]MCA9387422.1 preprotein translocase subunit SecY [Candidatus Andersenbacteria bacterium]